jgi:hypothetical protein
MYMVTPGFFIASGVMVSHSHRASSSGRQVVSAETYNKLYHAARPHLPLDPPMLS